MANEFKVKKGLIVSGSGGTLLDVQGSVGQVFSVTDSLTGDIFSVSDVSGIPIFNVNSDGTVTIDGPLAGTSATFAGDVKINKDSPLLILKNTTNEHTNGGAESKIVFKDHADNSLGQIEVSHNGTNDNSLGNMYFQTNNSSALVTALTLNSSQNATFAGSITAGTSSKFQVLGSGYIQLGNCTISASGDDNHIHVTCPTALIPNSTTLANNTRLGTAAYRWKDLHCGPGNFEGSVTASADVIAYSDARLKENVKTLDGSKVLQMRGVSFDRKDNGASSSGVIAQEMQKVAPELVSDDEGTLGVAYGNLTGYLIEAIKEQQKQIDELKSQIAACNKTARNCNCKN